MGRRYPTGAPVSSPTCPRPGRHPLEVSNLVGLALVAVVGLIAPNPGAPSSRFPPTLQVVWYGGLLVGAAITAVGLARGPVVGRLIERAGLFALCGMCLGYAAAAVGWAGVHGLGGAALIGSFGVGAGFRVWRIGRDLDHARAWAAYDRACRDDNHHAREET